MNPSIDLYSRVDKIAAEHKLRCQNLKREPGGGGINVSRAIKKLGGESQALYPSGGPIGKMLQNLLDEEGLKHETIRIEGWSRENIIVLEESTNQQFRFSMPGPHLSELEWRQCLNNIESLDHKPDYIVASGSLPPGVPTDFYGQLCKLARKINSKIIVDTSGIVLKQAIEEEVFLIKPNVNELEKLAGEEIENEKQMENFAAKLIRDRSAENIVISLGAGGAILVTKDKTEYIRSPAVHIRSRVGAGDSMIAGIVLSLARGNSLVQAARFGVAAGAASVMTPGTELCRKEDTERIYMEIKNSDV